jgi:hypothetical protein
METWPVVSAGPTGVLLYFDGNPLGCDQFFENFEPGVVVVFNRAPQPHGTAAVAEHIVNPELPETAEMIIQYSRIR